MKTKSAFFGNRESSISQVYSQGRRERVADRTDLYPHRISEDNFDEHAGNLRDLQVVFSTWGMPPLQAVHLDRLPGLQAVFYGAGSVQRFASPFLERDILVCSAWRANAVPVAEYTLAQILLANKGYYRNIRECATYEGRRDRPFRGRGNFGATVSLLGAGAVGKTVIELLKPFNLEILVFDPFMPDDAAEVLGVRKVSIEEAFSEGDIVSNHLANNEQTRGMLHGRLFARLQDHATFINTGRGATVAEPDLIVELQKRPTLTALLDVTFPEPPEKASPFYALPNVVLTSHIAGSLNDEVVRMADYMIEEFERWEAGAPLLHQVSKEILETMA